MSKRAKRIIATAALLVSGGALMSACGSPTVGGRSVTEAGFRPCGSDEVLYNPSTDDIAVYYSPSCNYVVFRLGGQPLTTLDRSGSFDYDWGGYHSTPLVPRWKIETANKVKELRATGRCKTSAGG